MNEDEIIAEGLASVREGIIAGNWQLVCDGYNSISGEDLKPMEDKPKSRLELIREKLSKSKPIIPDKPQVDYNTFTVKQLQDELVKQGFEKRQFKGKKKADLIEILEKNFVPAEEPDEDEDELNGFVPIDESDINMTKQKGGKKFGRGTISIISDTYDETTAKKNAKFAKKKIAMPRNRVIPPDANSTNENAAFRFHNENKRPVQALDN